MSQKKENSLLVLGGQWLCSMWDYLVSILGQLEQYSTVTVEHDTGSTTSMVPVRYTCIESTVLRYPRSAVDRVWYTTYVNPC